jgi:hypothetical protein
MKNSKKDEEKLLHRPEKITDCADFSDWARPNSGRFYARKIRPAHVLCLIEDKMQAVRCNTSQHWFLAASASANQRITLLTIQLPAHGYCLAHRS